jgi:hypothetical protein
MEGIPHVQFSQATGQKKISDAHIASGRKSAGLYRLSHDWVNGRQIEFVSSHSACYPS